MNASLTIRPLKEHDLACCVSLFIEVFNAPPWNENWSESIVSQRFDECYGTPGFFGLLALQETEVVAFTLGYSEQWDKNRHYYLKEICVRTAEQGGGVGTTLMRALEGELLSRSIEKIYLLTARDTAAQAFYEKQGFYTSPKMILMGKWLKPLEI